MAWSTVRGGFKRLPPGVRTDLPVAAALVLCWLLLVVPWAHLVTGLVVIALVGVHLCSRWPQVRELLRRPRRPGSVWRWGWRFGHGLLLVVAAAMIASGLARWAGMPPQVAWHATSSYLLLLVVAVHLVLVRRPLRARLCRNRQSREETAA